MPNFSYSSKGKLATCDARLQNLFNAVINHVECKVLCGHRNKVEQDEAFAKGTSTVQWPNSRHNTMPSRAVDVAPYPIEWPNSSMSREEYTRAFGRWYMFVGFVRAEAIRLGIKIRCGADWDGDFEVKDQNFHDLPHFELVD